MIALSGLTKRFGPLTAVDDVSFSVDRGEVLGFLGPNGSGKTTTMRMITGFLPPSAGSAVVGGHDVAVEPPRRPTADRISAGGRPPVRGHDDQGLPEFHRRRARHVGRRCGAPHRNDGGKGRDRVGSAPTHRHSLQGLQAPRRLGAGPPPRPGRFDPRRADRRPGPQSKTPGPRPHPRYGARQGHHHFDPYPRGGGRRVYACRRHCQGPRGVRRYAP